jgi:predicted regulator of Ras-like GTPase activity (Roadblock/LC7/MglB family)
MDAKQALSDLTEISSQIRAAVLIEGDGTVAAATLEGERAKEMARAAQELLAAAERTRPGLGPGTLCQLEVATLDGSVFVIRDRGRVIAATTGPEPTVGLVFYDLKSCLRNSVEGKAKAPAAKRPVRAKRGPGEEARGNREVPPTSSEADEKPAPKTPRRRAPKKDDDAAS